MIYLTPPLSQLRLRRSQRQKLTLILVLLLALKLQPTHAPVPFVFPSQPAIAIPPRLEEPSPAINGIGAALAADQLRPVPHPNPRRRHSRPSRRRLRRRGHPRALLCALICVVGLAAATRCARSPRAGRGGGGSNSSASSSGPDAAATIKGLKKKALKALPKLAYEDAVAAAVAARGGLVAGEERILAECAICLSEFGQEEEIRVMPHCGHGFHVACVDTWLRAHSSCPSCRRVLVVDTAPNLPTEPKRCRKCEATEEASSSSSAGGDGAAGT